MLPSRKKRILIYSNRVKRIIQTVVDSRKEISISDFKKRYLKNSYPEGIIEKCVQEFGIDISDNSAFIAWPVFLGSDFDEINICAVNFGALVLYERNSYSANQNISSDVKRYIKAAINTLIVTNIQNVENGKVFRYWPTHIDFTDRVEAGTLNQTTLSLSSLLRFGFLEPEFSVEGISITEDQLINRYKFIISNINWILSVQTSGAQFGGAWSFAERCLEARNNNDIATAILPSHFCYEVIKKYYDYFVSSEGNTALVNKIDDTFLKNMEIACASFERWIENEQLPDGGYRRNSNCGESSFAHSCCGLLSFAYDDTKNSDSLNRLVSYLKKNYKRFDLSLDSVVDAYRYEFNAGGNTGYVPDAYEIFPEAVFLNNSIKAINDGIFPLLSLLNRIKLREINYVAIQKILDRFSIAYFNGTGKHYVINGRQSAQQGMNYPIYALYNVKTCMEKLRDNDKKTYKERQKYMITPVRTHFLFIAISLFLLGLVAVAYFISATDTLTSLLLSLVSILSPQIVRHIKGDNDYRINL